MTITVNPALLARMAQIPWFEHVGEPLPSQNTEDIYRISGWDEVPIYIHNTAWDDAMLEARNALTVHLHQHHHAEYQEWNKVTREAKAFLVSDIMPKMTPFQEEHGLTKGFLTTILWCLLAAIMEDAYRECSLRVHFFTGLLGFYKLGHFPCGWVEGEWPTGRLVVF